MESMPTFNDLKLQSLKESSSVGQLREGIEYATHKVSSLQESISNSVGDLHAATEKLDIETAKNCFTSARKAFMRITYYSEQLDRLIKLVSKKLGKPGIIKDASGKLRLYDPTLLLTNEELKAFESEIEAALKTEIERKKSS